MNILKIALSLQLLFLPFTILGQSARVDPTVHKVVQQRTDQIFDSLVKIRRDLHTYPEVSGQEKRTAKKIAEFLTSLGLEVHTDIGGNGVVGILETNIKGRRIAWRADMDALASEIAGDVAFKSKNEGVRHICGHDVNTAIALGIADVLSNLKEDLKGTVYFIFQPSEENYKGAKAMMDDGLFDIINPDEIYASHITPMPEGLIATRPGWLFADYKIVKISYRKSSDSRSKIQFTKDLISSLQTVEPDSKFWDTGNLLDPTIGLGNPNTIYKGYRTVNPNFTVEETDNQISISTFISSSDEKKMDSILPLLEQKIHESSYADDLIGVEYSFQRPVISNDKELTKKQSTAFLLFTEQIS
ncbi:M20 metallopeptidase family protein [Pontibacter rugosus]